jgi:glyoxylate carboligase
MKGAQILIESLKREGVQIMFGYPGGAVLPIFDQLYDAPIKFILTRHRRWVCPGNGKSRGLHRHVRSGSY